MKSERKWLLAGVASLWMVMFSGQSVAQSFKVCADPNNPPLSEKSGGGLENKLAELFAAELSETLEYTWFPQRLGFIRNTLKSRLPDSEEYRCDVVMGVPTGYELTATTQPYYRSTYALVYRKGKGLDGLKSPEEIDNLPKESLSKLRIAMFDRSPGTTWLKNHGLLVQGIPYQTMTGDASINTAQVLARDFNEGKIDMVIIWGPIAGYLVSHSPTELGWLPMVSTAGLKFDFPISMGVRHPDKARKQQLDELIRTHAAKIEALVREFRIPQVDEQGQPLP